MADFGASLVGSVLLLSAVPIVFIAANLAVRFTFSTIAKKQLQAMQMTFFFFLPSMLLSCFMFPIRGVPQWAQAIGEVLPLTHAHRARYLAEGRRRGGNFTGDLADGVVPMALFMALCLWRQRGLWHCGVISKHWIENEPMWRIFRIFRSVFECFVVRLRCIFLDIMSQQDYLNDQTVI